MSLTTIPAPAKCAQIVSDAIRNLMGPAGGAAGMAAAETSEVAAPHEVYTLGLEDVAHRDLGTAQKTAWRYLVVQGNRAVAAAEVNVAKGGAEMQFSHLNTGPFVEETNRAMAQAEKLEQVAGADYVVRLLTIPALYVVALWLHGEKNDLLIPMPPTSHHLTANRVYSPADFFERLVLAAEARKAFDDSPKKA